MTDLSEFLLARIDEDEERSRDHWAPVQLSAECDAKRQIVERYRQTLATANRKNSLEYYGSAHGLRWSIQALATAHADHPDYREEWRP